MLHASESRGAKNNEMVATYALNFEDAPRASVTASKTTRGSPPAPRIWKMLHASAFRRAANNERVTTYALNFEDAPRASIATRRKQREGRDFLPKFRSAPGTRSKKKKPREGVFFFAPHVARLCNMSHETFRNTRSKKKTPV